MNANTLKTVLGQPSWRVANGRTEVFVTQVGGQMAPVTFDRRGRKIMPFSVAPWAQEKLDPATPPIIRALRGDFFCLPFGGNGTPYRGEKHPIHGETANAKWSFVSSREEASRTCLRLELRTKVRKGRVEKLIALPHDHDAIYQRHIVHGMSGPMDFGHHAMLRFPDAPDEESSAIISTSRFTRGQVLEELIERPEARGYQSLKPGAMFRSLKRVPTLVGERTDLTRYPARRGFEDLVMISSDTSQSLAWTIVTFPKQRYAWFALKNPRVLASTIFWISNGGRHYAPWSGRHVNVMGIEEVTANFHKGLAESAKDNPIARAGIPTHMKLTPRKPLVVNYIMGVVALPSSDYTDPKGAFRVGPHRDGILIQWRRASHYVPVDLGFLKETEETEETEVA